MQDQRYLRAHPELSTLISAFVRHATEEKPSDALAFAGRFFTQEGLWEIVEHEEELAKRQAAH